MVDVDDIRAFERAWGTTHCPLTLTQRTCDFDEEFGRIRTTPRENLTRDDVYWYLSDLRYCDPQIDLLLHLLPVGLRLWREELFNADLNIEEQIHGALAAHACFKQQLDEYRHELVHAFLRNSLLRRMAAERCLWFRRTRDERPTPYVWVRFLAAFGVISDRLPALWSEWWRMSEPGHAVCVAQYVSCLVYPTNQNPVFSAWTPDEGGGPPDLWDFDGPTCRERWLQSNVDFIRDSLTVQYIRDGLERAARVLSVHSVARRVRQIRDDLDKYQWRIENRVAALPNLFSTTAEHGLRHWPDEET